MGYLHDGIWHTAWQRKASDDGRFRREEASLRHWVTPDGAAGPTGNAGFKAESGRYHLYVSLACPWAHRTLIFRVLKELEDHIDVSIVSPDMHENGWTFDTELGSTGDPINGAQFMHQVYTVSNPTFTGRVTVPVLWDKQTGQIVSNESADIIRMFNSAFDGLTGNRLDFYPEHLRADIDAVNALVYDSINNGVYRTGFATAQDAYEEAYGQLFSALDQLENRLSNHPYLVGTRLTEADCRLFPTLIRFDAVYHGHFKCNRQRLEDFPNLSNYVRALYQMPGIAGTVNMDHIKNHYYRSHTMINPTGIVPAGPAIDYGRPHDRDRFNGITP